MSGCVDVRKGGEEGWCYFAGEVKGGSGLGSRTAADVYPALIFCGIYVGMCFVA